VSSEVSKVESIDSPTANLESLETPNKTVETAALKESTIDDLEAESMAPGESMAIPNGVSPESDAAKDTWISAPEAQTDPGKSLEPMKKHYADAPVTQPAQELPPLAEVAVRP
jgi:hypothetical protein